MHYQGFSSRGVFLTLQCPSLSVHICASVPISLCVCGCHLQAGRCTPHSPLGAKWFSLPNNRYLEIYIPPSDVTLSLIFILITEH